jgi:hypothetical protein
MSVMLATWETEVRRIEVLGQPGQVDQETPHLKGKICDGECLLSQVWRGKPEMGGPGARLT